MIKFFRQIRYNLMNSGKTSKYFKYAIGEIILVMIGILLALQVNNWNQNRLRAIEEVRVLKALKVGLETDLTDLNYNATSIQNSIAHANTVLKSLKNNEPYRDSIADHFGIMMFPVKFLYSTSAFETLKAKGIDLVTNAQLRDAIVGVYDSNYTFFLETEKVIVLDEVERGFRTVLPSRFEESYVFDLSKANYMPRLVPLNFEILKQDQEFIYFIKSYRNRLNTFLNFHYKKIIMPQVENLIDELDAEIKTLEN
ncbi:MAG: hypothetical protein HKN00_11180 [Flavobacteriaceae bacterium]|nr:hypothetical protein [Bacteroidia bacterium]MBT8287574.1 hypothetical protein [Bacteroidia bacterium]NNF75740.1 hypothetical protein [Flavobacteriaceae bacterium]